MRLADGGEVHPVDGRPEGVPDGHAQQRSAHPAPEVLLLGTTPHGSTARRAHLTSRGIAPTYDASTVIERAWSIQGPEWGESMA
ncbi:hypothetical protein GCM10010216_57840 [Streptomyces flaveolus]|nr:hypothetical protein GCM10010216_57840 [Streptomyces flaveolus]